MTPSSAHPSRERVLRAWDRVQLRGDDEARQARIEQLEQRIKAVEGKTRDDEAPRARTEQLEQRIQGVERKAAELADRRASDLALEATKMQASQDLRRDLDRLDETVDALLDRVDKIQRELDEQTSS